MGMNIDNAPFFSVLIPTKNRAHLVGYAIQSVLSQDFEDFEIILVDNDDGEKTYHAVGQFNDPRIKYFRTGGLNMSENWEFALAQAHGKYITVLEDKQAYFPWALKKIHLLLTSRSLEVLVWEWDSFDDTRRQASRNKRTGTFEEIYSDDILDLYMTRYMAAWKFLPRMLNSCASVEMIKRIKSSNKTGKFFDELSPDLCAAFYLLAYVNTIGMLNDGLGMLGYMHLSNAKKIALGGKSSDKYYGKANISEEAVRFVPIKSSRLVHNIVYNDFLRIRSEVGARLRSYEMSQMAYTKVCLRDVVRNFYRGGQSWADFVLIYDYTTKVDFGIVKKLQLISYLFVELLKPPFRRFAKARRSKEVWSANDIYQAVQNRPAR